MAWLPNGEKNFGDMFIHFDTTHECDRHRHTHKQIVHDGIGCSYAQHCVAIKPTAINEI